MSLVLVILDLLRISRDASWFEEHVDFVSMQAVLSASRWFVRHVARRADIRAPAPRSQLRRARLVGADAHARQAAGAPDGRLSRAGRAGALS